MSLIFSSTKKKIVKTISARTGTECTYFYYRPSKIYSSRDTLALTTKDAKFSHVLWWQDKWRLEERVLMIEQSAAAMADEICR